MMGAEGRPNDAQPPHKRQATQPRALLTSASSPSQPCSPSHPLPTRTAAPPCCSSAGCWSPPPTTSPSCAWTSCPPLLAPPPAATRRARARRPPPLARWTSLPLPAPPPPAPPPPPLPPFKRRCRRRLCLLHVPAWSDMGTWTRLPGAAIAWPRRCMPPVVADCGTHGLYIRAPHNPAPFCVDLRPILISIQMPLYHLFCTSPQSLRSSAPPCRPASPARLLPLPPSDPPTPAMQRMLSLPAHPSICYTIPPSTSCAPSIPQSPAMPCQTTTCKGAALSRRQGAAAAEKGPGGSGAGSTFPAAGLLLRSVHTAWQGGRPTGK